MHQVTLDEAKNHLVDLIDAAVAGEEVFITKDEGTAVQLVPRIVKRRKRQFGSARGLISMAPNFDEPLEEFKEYQAQIEQMPLISADAVLDRYGLIREW